MVDGAGYLFFKAAILKEQERRDATDVKERGDLLVAGSVNLCDDRFVNVYNGKIVDLWGHHLAGAAGRGKKVDQNREWGHFYKFVEAVIGKFHWNGLPGNLKN